jgi:hypothetical protein
MNFMASEDADACQTALAIQEKAGWPTIEVWASHRQLPCESPPIAVPSETEGMDPDETWGRKIEPALGYRPRAKQLRAAAATMVSPEAKRVMYEIAAKYEQMADRLSLPPIW